MQTGDSARDFVDPRCRIAAAVGDPIGVDLEPDGAVQLCQQNVQSALAVKFCKFVAVIVIADGQIGSGVFFSSCVVLLGELKPIGSGWIFWKKSADRGV